MKNTKSQITLYVVARACAKGKRKVVEKYYVCLRLRDKGAFAMPIDLILTF